MVRRLALPLAAGGLVLAAAMLAWLVLRPRDGGSLLARDAGGVAAVEDEREVGATPSTSLAEPTSPVAGPDGLARRREVEAGLLGRVVDDRDGAPVPDAWVDLLGAPRSGEPQDDPRVLAEAATDAAGRFVLPWPTEPGSWVRVHAPYGWIALDPAWARVPESPGEELEFRLRPLRSAPLRLVLEDARTGEPVPFYLLGVRHARLQTTVHVMTDGLGRGATDVALEEGTYELLGYDDPRSDRRAPLNPPLAFDAEPDGAPTRVSILVGPTFLLDVRGPPGLALESLRVFLASDETDLLRGARFEGARMRGELRGGWPWVRVPVREAANHLHHVESAERLLVVVDRGGEWSGFAPVTLRWGVHPDPVTVELRRMGRLEVRVVDEHGEDVAGARVVLQPVTGARSQSVQTHGDGPLQLGGLPAGAYVVQASHVTRDRALARVVVEGGRTTKLVLVTPTTPIAGDVEGRVVGGAELAANAWERTGLRVSLRSTDGAGRSYEVRLLFEAVGDELIARFRFEGVPAGDYVCGLQSYRPAVWWPYEQAVRPPASGLLIREVAADELSTLAIEVRDQASGEPLSAKLWAAIDGIEQTERSLQAPYFAAREYVHRDAALAWGVGAAGHVPRFGDRADLELREDELRGEVRLARGFGVRLDVVGPDRRPIVGATVSVDGVEAGATDALGRLLVVAAAPPASAEVRYLDWVCLEDLASLLARAGESGRPVVEVRLTPP